MERRGRGRHQREASEEREAPDIRRHQKREAIGTRGGEEEGGINGEQR